ADPRAVPFAPARRLLSRSRVRATGPIPTLPAGGRVMNSRSGSLRRVPFGLVAFVFAVASTGAVAPGLPPAPLTGHVATAAAARPGLLGRGRAPTPEGSPRTETPGNGVHASNTPPPGDYTITFARQSFTTQTKPIALGAPQRSTLDTDMSVTAVSAETNVIAT